MKKILFLMAASLMGITAMAQSVPSFPGAEGHGRYVEGGRGGVVKHVTNLNDSGTGSLRAAVSGSAKKIIVFDVAGVIALKSDLTIGDNTTIAGQTAPYPGITLRYRTIRPGANNVIRFIRIRRGQEKDVNDGADALWQRQKTGILLDHCSFSWSIDEVASFYDNNNFTMQWCTLGESLNNAGHGKGAHGYGGIWGGKLASFHHNMIAHVNNRSPRFCGARYNWTGYTSNKLYSQYQWGNAVQAEIVDMRNCVIYNCGNGCYGGPGGGYVNMVNNYFKTGPAGSTTRVTQISVGDSGNSSDNSIYWGLTSRYYLSGNQVNGNANYDWSGVSYDSGVLTKGSDRYCKDPNHYYGSDVSYESISGTDCVKIKLDSPTETGEVTTHNATNAYNKVLSYAGASLFRDEVDDRYATEARNGTATYKGSVTGKAGRIDLVSDVNGYTEENFPTGSRPADFDTDGDGIPDVWEKANGLDPNNASDAALYTLDSEKKWYTNLEVYLNSLVEDIMKKGNADALTSVDEYYPQCTKVDVNSGNTDNPGEITATDVYILAASNNDASKNTQSSYAFSKHPDTNGDETQVTITNEKSKAYSAGKEDGIKYSAGVQYTITIPAGLYVTSIDFKGYDNYADADSYISEVNGVEYSSTDYVFPQKDGSGNYTVVTRSVTLPTPASRQLTFTVQGKQVVLVITLHAGAATTGIRQAETSSAATVARTYYNIQGQRISQPSRGIYIVVEKQADGTTRSRKVTLN